MSRCDSIKKQGFIPTIIIVALVSYFCIKGMKVVDKKMEKDKKKS